jgi:amidase
LRIAFTSDPFLPGDVHEDCVKGLESTVELCRDLGHELVEAAPKVDGHAFARAFLTMVCGETRADIEEAEALVGRRATYRDFEPATWAVGLLGRQTTAAEFSMAVRRLQRSARQIGHFFEEYDVLLTPTLARPPLVTGALQPRRTKAFAMRLLGRLNAGGLMEALAGIEALADQVFEFMPYTPVFNATGQPAMSVPLHWNDGGLPIGMHFAGRYGDEATLFRLAGQLEKASPWFDHLPPICG